jgi:small conductance mechanosensitive channel
MLAVTPFWKHAAIALAMIGVTSVIAKIVDWRISRHALAPEAATRYRVFRRTAMALIVFVGLLSALLVVPEVRAVAGGVLASGAVIGLVIGFASQRTIGNAVAGILIAFAQPLRLGDEVEVAGTKGVVEEIGLSYTWLRTRDNDRFVVPNEKLASDVIRNSTIRSESTLAEIKVQVPGGSGLRRTVAGLEGVGDEVYVSSLQGDNAIVTVRKWIAGEEKAERAESDLRIAVSELLAEGAT